MNIILKSTWYKTEQAGRKVARRSGKLYATRCGKPLSKRVRSKPPRKPVKRG